MSANGLESFQSCFHLRHSLKKRAKIQNLSIFSRITFEFPATGGAIPLARFRTVKLLKYVSAGDYFIMACEFIFVAFIFYYYVEEAIEIRKHKLAYFFNVWNSLDMIVIIVATICMGFGFYSNQVVTNRLKDLLDQPDQFADFTALAELNKGAFINHVDMWAIL